MDTVQITVRSISPRQFGAFNHTAGAFISSPVKAAAYAELSSRAAGRSGRATEYFNRTTRTPGCIAGSSGGIPGSSSGVPGSSSGVSGSPGKSREKSKRLIFN